MTEPFSHVPPGSPPPAGSADLAEALAASSAEIRRGALADAGRRLRMLLASHPDVAAVHAMAATLEVAAGRPAQALPMLQRAVALEPGHAMLRLDLGRLLAHAGRRDEALVAFAAALERDPRLADAWYLQGLTLARAGRVIDALPFLRRAHELAPGERTLDALASAEFQAGFPADALPLWRELQRRRPDDETTILSLGETLSRLGDGVEALSLFADAASRHPRSPGLALALAQAHEAVGAREAAAAAFARALELRPHWPFALGSLLGLLRAQAPAERLAEAEALLAGPLSLEDEAILAYESGKVFDARGDAVAAMARWDRANAARRRSHGEFDAAALRAQVDAVIAAYPAGAVAAACREAPAPEDSRPVFVVGMPRSGTTLTEQILGAHPSAWACGELLELALIARRLPVRGGGARAWPVAPADLAPGALADARQRWLQGATRHAPAAALRLVDKEPLNFQLLGLAASMFPQSRVIWCRRDPRDIAVSIYGENFAVGQHFATSLAGIGVFIREQERLMRHWLATLPLPILELHYEELVAEPETQARRLVEFVGLPWDGNCLQFHRSDRVVHTPSRWQVREPVHARSAGRWRRYATMLGPLLAALEAPDTASSPPS